MPRGPVAFVSCAAAIADGIDYDMGNLVAAADEAGLAHEVVAWDDPAVDWSSFSLCVVRSTWNYHEDRDAFLRWCARVDSESTIANSVSLLTWNTDKHYLAELAEAGLPVVPTTFVEPHVPESTWQPAIERLLADGDVVVKPAVSAGSNDTERHSEIASAAAQVSALLARGKSVMLQPYFSHVDLVGETGLVFVDGTFSHAFGKGAILAGAKSMTGDLYAEEEISARTANDDERAVGERALATITARFGTPLYARVDLLPSADGPTIIELELAEPSLYLSLGEGAAARVVAAITAIAARV